MTAYYNEINPFAAAWLRELIKAGHIAPGEVDERSIEDVIPTDLRGFTQCHFFAGIGVWSYALRQAGWPDNRPVWTGSCPCQPFSTAGKRKGTADERHLWPSLYHLISHNQPVTFFGEQVASKDGLAWLDIVQSDLEATNYSVGAMDICAASVGAPHIRQRLYFVADSQCSQKHQEQQRPETDEGEWGSDGISRCGLALPTRSESERSGYVRGFWRNADWIPCRDGRQRPVEPGTFPLAHGSPNRVGRLRGYGNALVAPVAQAFIEAFMESEK